MRLLGVVSILVASTFLAGTGVAFAGPVLGDDTRGDDNDGDDRYGFPIIDEDPGRPGEPLRVQDGPDPLATLTYRRVDTDPATGADCTRTFYILVYDEAQRGPATDTVRLEERRYDAETGGVYPPPCSGLVVDPGAPAREAAAMVAGQLEPAEPYVQPDNRAITGMRSYLATNIDSTWSEVVTVPLLGRGWDVQVDVEGVHTVDWGDGTVDVALTGDGGPWHEGAPVGGDISHGYIDTGDVPLVVTTDWTVTATLLVNGETATQTATTTSTPVTIDVTEVRSSRQR